MSLPSSETWRPVPGYEGLYEVSDHGRVRTLPRWHVRDVRVHQGFVRPSDGYVQIALRKDRRQRAYRAHQLVMLAFVGPCPPGMEVRHLNGDPADNRLSNLAYGTKSENEHDKVRHGTHVNASRTHCRQGHPFDASNTGVGWNGGRVCKACDREKARRYRARRSAKEVPA